VIKTEPMHKYQFAMDKLVVNSSSGRNSNKTD